MIDLLPIHLPLFTIGCPEDLLSVNLTSNIGNAVTRRVRVANRNLCCAGVAFGIYSYRISRTSVTVKDANWKQNRAGKTETVGYEAERQDPKT